MMKTKSLVVLVKDAQKVVNRTVSSITKKAPVENIKEEQSELSKKYNKKRGKDSGIKIKRKALKVGDMVRIPSTSQVGGLVRFVSTRQEVGLVRFSSTSH